MKAINLTKSNSSRCDLKSILDMPEIQAHRPSEPNEDLVSLQMIDLPIKGTVVVWYEQVDGKWIPVSDYFLIIKKP